MKSRSRTSIYIAFFLKSFLAASVIMFICMALGEIFYDENLFSGFLRRPQIWLGIFIETSMATLLMTTIGALVLYRFRFLEKKVFTQVSTATWCLLGVLLIVLYSYFYWPQDWHLTAMAPGLFFGWILPGVLTVICFVWLSLDLRQTNKN